MLALPAACFWRMISAADSLLRCISVPLMLVPFFYAWAEEHQPSSTKGTGGAFPQGEPLWVERGAAVAHVPERPASSGWPRGPCRAGCRGPWLGRDYSERIEGGFWLCRGEVSRTGVDGSEMSAPRKRGLKCQGQSWGVVAEARRLFLEKPSGRGGGWGCCQSRPLGMRGRPSIDFAMAYYAFVPTALSCAGFIIGPAASASPQPYCSSSIGPAGASESSQYAYEEPPLACCFALASGQLRLTRYIV